MVQGHNHSFCLSQPREPRAVTPFHFPPGAASGVPSFDEIPPIFLPPREKGTWSCQGRGRCGSRRRSIWRMPAQATPSPDNQTPGQEGSRSRQQGTAEEQAKGWRRAEDLCKCAAGSPAPEFLSVPATPSSECALLPPAKGQDGLAMVIPPSPEPSISPARLGLASLKECGYKAGHLRV